MNTKIKNKENETEKRQIPASQYMTLSPLQKLFYLGKNAVLARFKEIVAEDGARSKLPIPETKRYNLPNASNINRLHRRTLLLRKEFQAKTGFCEIYDLLRTENNPRLHGRHPGSYINHLPLTSLRPADRETNIGALRAAGASEELIAKWEWPVSFESKHILKIVQLDGELPVYAGEIARILEEPLLAEDRFVPINRFMTYKVSASGIVTNLRVFEHAPGNRRVILRELKPLDSPKGRESFTGLDAQVIWEHPTALKTAA
jgi:hypothetical protein